MEGVVKFSKNYRRAQITRETRAAVTIQRYTRGWLCRHKYHQLHRSVLGIQKYARGLLARKSFKIKLDDFKVK
jgi:myosin V